MNPPEKAEIIQCPVTHYIYIEKIGQFYESAPQAWNNVHKLVPGISGQNKIVGFMSLYKVKPHIYRAAFALAAPPQNLPEGMDYAYFKGGKYSRFVLTGLYSDLPEASGRVFEIVSEEKIRMRDDFCIENYTADPSKTAEGENIT